MAGIQTTVGLTTGMDIGSTVTQLMKLAARPREALQTRTDTLKSEQLAVTELSAYLLSARLVTDNLGKETVFTKRSVTSSNQAALSGIVTGDPATGVHQFTPLRTASFHQVLSSGLRSASEPLGTGKLTFRFGANVERPLSVDQLQGGQGIARGKIRITDRSGVTAEVDLTAVQTVDDVLDAINGTTAINVTATADGDRIRLTDNTGQAVSNLKVQEVGRGTTAASLGLAGIDVDDDSAAGTDLVRLNAETQLDDLNDGRGVHVSNVLPDIAFTLRDGTSGVIDFTPLATGAGEQKEEITLGEIVDAINATSPNKLKAEIAPDGKRLVLTDLTAGEGAFALTGSSGGSNALRDLGLDGATAADGVITGRRLTGGLKTSLLSSLGGGAGLGQLGILKLVDRSGAVANVDLSTTETLQDVVERINAAGVGVTARINDARNGIQLDDTSGGSGHLVVANFDGTSTADKLHLATNSAVNSANSGDLHLAILSAGTRLDDLNGGAGVARGKIAVYDTRGNVGLVDLTEAQTVGDVILAFGRTAANVRAEINATGDGLVIIDQGSGNETLRVEEYDSTTAADLHLLGSSTTQIINGSSAKVLEGSFTHAVEIDADDTLDDLVTKINALGSGVSAKKVNDGSSRPYHLSLTSTTSGAIGQMMVDSSQAGFSFYETAKAQDALLAIGTLGANGGLLAASANNQFEDVIPGVRLQVGQASSTPVSISVQTSNTDLVASVKAMVENYNRFRKKLNESTAYDATTDKRSVLSGSHAALRLDTELSGLLTGRFYGNSSIQSLRQVGVNFKDDGTLEFDQAKLEEIYAADPEGVRDFFSKKDVGFSAKFNKLCEQLSGQDVSLMAQRFKALQTQIEQNEDKIASLDARLVKETERMYLQFYRMELAIAKIKNQSSVLDSLQYIEMPSGSSSSSSE